jgi:hypothetical protein
MKVILALEDANNLDQFAKQTLFALMYGATVPVEGNVYQLSHFFEALSKRLASHPKGIGVSGTFTLQFKLDEEIPF